MVSLSLRALRPLLAVCAGVLLASGAARAAAAAAVPTAPVQAVPASAASTAKPVAASAQGGQRNKMKACNDEARQKGLHKADRRAFMKQCLSKPSAG
jgi:hypothetical protein